KTHPLDRHLHRPKSGRLSQVAGVLKLIRSSSLPNRTAVLPSISDPDPSACNPDSSAALPKIPIPRQANGSRSSIEFRQAAKQQHERPRLHLKHPFAAPDNTS
ncbi:hypothetical protein ACLOJK_018945, partial [Asimina triloba]